MLGGGWQRPLSRWPVWEASACERGGVCPLGQGAQTAGVLGVLLHSRSAIPPLCHACGYGSGEP